MSERKKERKKDTQYYRNKRLQVVCVILVCICVCVPAELDDGSWLVEGRLASSEGCAASSASV